MKARNSLLFLVTFIIAHASEKHDNMQCAVGDLVVQALLLNIAGRVMIVRWRAGEIVTDFALSQNLDARTEQVSSSVVYGDWSREVVRYATEQKNTLPKLVVHPYQIILYGLAATERALVFGSIDNKKIKACMERTRKSDILLMKTLIESETLSFNSYKKIEQELPILKSTHEIWQQKIRDNNLTKIVHKNSAYTEIVMALESKKENIVDTCNSKSALFTVYWDMRTRDNNGKEIELSGIESGVMKE